MLKNNYQEDSGRNPREESRPSSLRVLAAATTAYYEASPESIEIARVVYEQAIDQFNRESQDDSLNESSAEDESLTED